LGKVVPAKEAIQAIAPGSLIVFPGCCSEPQTLIEALLEDSERLAGTKLISGLLFSNYSFVQPPYQGKFRYATWHVMRPIRDLVIGGEVDYIPLRGSQIVKFLEKNNIDVVFIQTSPPDRAGYLSLGASVSYIQPLVKKAKVVIAEATALAPTSCPSKPGLAIKTRTGLPFPLPMTSSLPTKIWIIRLLEL